MYKRYLIWHVPKPWWEQIISFSPAYKADENGSKWILFVCIADIDLDIDLTGILCRTIQSFSMKILFLRDQPTCPLLIKLIATIATDWSGGEYIFHACFSARCSNKFLRARTFFRIWLPHICLWFILNRAFSNGKMYLQTPPYSIIYFPDVCTV